MRSMGMPEPLSERGGPALQWESLRSHIALRTESELGRRLLDRLEPTADRAWIETQQDRAEEMRRLAAAGSRFAFRGIFDPEDLLGRARLQGAALEPNELLRVLTLAERGEAWRTLMLAPPETLRAHLPAIASMSQPLVEHALGKLVDALEGKIDPDGTLADDASPELGRIRRALGRQHRAIEDSLHRALARLGEEGVQDALITVRGERFVIPVKAEFRRRAGGVVHGSSSSGATVFVEPMETIEENNELIRLLDEEQAEVHRILVAMTRAVAGESDGLIAAATVLAQADVLQAIARFAETLDCVRPVFCADDSMPKLALQGARHPLLELRLREAQQSDGSTATIVPLDLSFPPDVRQMILSGPNTGGKTVVLKTAGLLVLMAQAGLPVPAHSARLPLFTAVYADIGDSQSIENNLSTFSAHVVNVNRIAQVADPRSLVLLDELGSATDPEEGAALAAAVAEFFLRGGCWCLVTTHLTSMKIYAARHAGVVNAAVGFDPERLAPTFDLRIGVPGASAGLNIAARLGLQPDILAHARANLTTQQADIAKFLDELHASIRDAQAEREQLRETERKLAAERAHLQQQGRAELQQRTRELERKLATMIGEAEAQLRSTVQAVDDKKVAAKLQRESALRLAQLRRETAEQFQSAVQMHNRGSKDDQPASRKAGQPRVGDLVKLKSLGSEGRVLRLLDSSTVEVGFGAMKSRVAVGDIAEITPVRDSPVTRPGRRSGISVVSGHDDESDAMPYEINVIGRSADEAEGEVERFVERAFLAGRAQVRVVHGVGMGVLRRTLREFLRKHPYVTGTTEPPHNEGGQGVTLVDLKQ